MDPLYRLQPVNSHTDRADGLFRPEQHSWFPVLGSEHGSYAQPSDLSSLQSYYTTPNFGASDISSQSYRSADSSLSHSTTNSASTASSSMSFPYSVTSINSRKSRKNVLYPRRAHSPPVAVSSEHYSISPDDLIWQVQSFCTTWLPHGETRFVPPGRVLLQSLGLHGDFSQRVPVRIDEETRCCSELYIALTHEVLLKDAVSAEELEVPCRLLHATFKDILSKSGAFSCPKSPRSNEADPKAPTVGALELQRFSNVLIALFSVLNAFEGALNTIKIKPAAAKDGALRDYYRMALLGLLVSTGLTIKQYRIKLDQYLAQTQAQLKSLGQPEVELPPSMGVIPTIPPYKGAPQEISTIEEDSEAEGEGSKEGSSVSGHTQSHSTQSHSDSGKRSLPRRILRRLIPSSIGRKEV
ncbi:hypothetical protein BJY52DRAFT_1210857 [Lactarius psammicola]|nr:hypothetical protein BJY52DRAFT_1210857 [Lactarius psammicola]